jgi:AcrR family transcriptional regulator
MSDLVSLKTAPLAGQVLSGQFGARLLDLTGETTPWQRRLWSLGTVLALRELHEAGPWVDAQVLSPAALQWLCRDLERLAGDDAGLGTPEVRRQLRDALRADLSRHSRHRRRLHELIAVIDELYIPRWTAAAEAPAAVSSERLARAVVAHLLDRGYSMGFLHRTLRRRIASGATVGDFLAEAGRLASASPRQFEVLVPFLIIPSCSLRKDCRSGAPDRRFATG